MCRRASYGPAIAGPIPVIHTTRARIFTGDLPYNTNLRPKRNAVSAGFTLAPMLGPADTRPRPVLIQSSKGRVLRINPAYCLRGVSPDAPVRVE